MNEFDYALPTSDIHLNPQDFIDYLSLEIHIDADKLCDMMKAKDYNAIPICLGHADSLKKNLYTIDKLINKSKFEEFAKARHQWDCFF